MEVEEMAESSYAVEDVGNSETLTFSGVQGDYNEEIITEESVIEEQIVLDKRDTEEPASSSFTDYAEAQFPTSSGTSDGDSYGTPVARLSTSYQDACEVRETDSFVRDETSVKDGEVEEMFDNEEECMEEVVGAEDYEADDIIELEEEEEDPLSEKEQEANDGVEDEDARIETLELEHQKDDVDREEYLTTENAAQQDDHIEDFAEIEEEVTERVIELDKEHMSENEDERFEHVEETVEDLEENISEDLGDKDQGEDGTVGTEADIQAEKNALEEREDRTGEDKQNVSETSEREEDCTVGTEASFQSVADDSAECSMLQDDSPNTTEQQQSDVSSLSADLQHPTTPIKAKSKPAVQHKVSRRKSATPKKAKLTKASVPTVTVTAPSDQSEDSEIDTPSAAPSVTVTPTLSSYPKKIESCDKLPAGWKRIAVLRLSGQHMGRYDTTLHSDTNVKMRSFPNVQAYLEKTGQQDLLDDKQYDFKFNQPFSKQRGKGKTSTPRQKEVKVKPSSAKERKTPKSNSVKTSNSKTPTTAKVCMTLKRKLPVGENCQQESGDSPPALTNIWEVMPTQKPKARKKTTAASKNSPQIKLDGFISKVKSPQIPKESKFKSSFKSVLQKNKSLVKEPQIVKEEVKDSETVADSKTISTVKSDDADKIVEVTEKQIGNVEEENDDVKEEEACQDDLLPYDSDKEETVDRKDNAERGDTQGECDEDVYLAEEQDLCRSDEDDVDKAKTDDVPMDMAGAREQGQKDNLSEECASDASIFEVKSAESDNSLPPISESLDQSNTSHNKRSGGSTSKVHSTSAARTSKRSRSHSDSDMSSNKRARLWREADVEEDSSRSVGMCSDTSMPGQEEEENQHMASKVQKLHLSDSSSSKDMKDSASTSSSNSTSLTLATPLLAPSWNRSKAKSAKTSPAHSSGKTSPAKKSASGKSHVESSPKKSETLKTNGATSTLSQVKSHRDVAWTPPRSPFNLIQERLCHDPWKMLVATIFLQELEAEAAIPLLWKFLNRWPTAEQVRSAETERIARLLHPMERNETCAATVVQFCEEYETRDWLYPIELHGIDKCGNDSFRIFCVPEWKQVAPDDGRLKSYHTWLCDNAEELGVE